MPSLYELYCALKVGAVIVFDNHCRYKVIENVVNDYIIFDNIDRENKCYRLFYDDIDNHDYFEIYEG